MSLNNLFSPLAIRGMKMKNRIVMPAMGTKFAHTDRTVSDQLIDYHEARAKGGCGLNMVEVASVHGPSAPRSFVAIYDDSFIAGLKRLTDAIHGAGGLAGIQLWQGGLAASFDEACQILLPSPMPVSETMTIPAMDHGMIPVIVDCFAAAAKRAVQAGFDCVEIHAAHNYILHSFLSPYFNRREDEYGGSFENRARFPLAVIRAVRAAVPDTMPVFMRIDAHDDFLEGGLTIEDVIAFCKLAKEAGVDVVDVSRGNIVSAGIQYEVPPVDLPRGFNIENAVRIKEETGLITMGVGRINDPEQAEEILAAGKVDLVGIGRGQLADAEFCNKSKEGRYDELVRCVGCNQGCYDGFADKKCPHITCLRNPALGKEKAYALKKTERPLTVLVAGGGPAGLEAAYDLKLRGHNPILCEAGESLGGQFRLAGEAPRKAEMKAAAIHMGEMAKEAGVDVRLNTPVTPELIREMKPDAVFCAIGSEPLHLNVPGAENLLDSHKVLKGEQKAKGNVVVIGGGLVGLECAEYITGEGGSVTVLEMLPEVGADLGDIRKAAVLGNLYGSGVQTVTEARFLEYRPGAVVYEKDGKTEEIPCDCAVSAVGARARSSEKLEQAARSVGIPWFVIGDAAKARRALNATAEAAKLARTFDEPKALETARHTKKVIFLTGASGSMGLEGMKQILDRNDRFRLRILVRPSAKNKALMKDYNGNPGLEIVWGDLDNYDHLKRCVTGADYVLHVGALVSPEADRYPKQSMITNYGSTKNLIWAIKEQPNQDEIHLIYIGTVAETGCRMAPIHWGRCGDPIKGSVFDYYAVSKIAAERAVIDSGLKHWVSLRQTGIMPPKESAAQEPIIFHQPPANVLEWVTNMESGILLANACEDWVPEDFWRKVYNIGGGDSFRITYSQYFDDLLKPLGFGFQDVFEPQWFARFNFHGQWYTDSDALNDILRFRVMTYEQYVKGAQDAMAAMAANPMAAGMLPTKEGMKSMHERIARSQMGTLWMQEPGNEDWVSAFFGSREAIAGLPARWEDVDLTAPSKTPVYLDHGYDESKPVERLTEDDLRAAAEFRGGRYLGSETGDFYGPARWKCAFGHEFTASPNLVLKGGHWCPECERISWNYPTIAKRSPFFNQVWAPLHGESEQWEIKKTVSDLDVETR